MAKKERSRMDIQEFELKEKYSLILDLSLQANDTPELQLEKNLHPTKYNKQHVSTSS